MKHHTSVLLLVSSFCMMGVAKGGEAHMHSSVSACSNMEATVLAAGRSSRFKGRSNKLITKMCGRELLLYPLCMLHELGVPTHVILNPEGAKVRAVVEQAGLVDIFFHTQEKPLGTGHAVRCAQAAWTKDHILILNGDTPLVDKKLVQNLYAKHIETDATVTFVTCIVDRPNELAYGRVLHENGRVRIIEQKDCTDQERNIACVNAGIYIAKRAFLTTVLSGLKPSSASGEIYITDIVERASQAGATVSMVATDLRSILGVNQMTELADVQRIKQRDIIQKWLKEGVRFIDAEHTYVDVTAQIGPRTVIGAGVHILGASVIGAECTIEPYTIIKDSTIEPGTFVSSYAQVYHTHVSEHTELPKNM